MTSDEFKQIRQSLGMTQLELARYLGYKGESAVAHIESGKHRVNSAVRRLMEILRDSEGRILTEKWD